MYAPKGRRRIFLNLILNGILGWVGDGQVVANFMCTGRSFMHPTSPDPAWFFKSSQVPVFSYESEPEPHYRRVQARRPGGTSFLPRYASVIWPCTTITFTNHEGGWWYTATWHVFWQSALDHCWCGAIDITKTSYYEIEEYGSLSGDLGTSQIAPLQLKPKGKNKDKIRPYSQIKAKAMFVLDLFTSMMPLLFTICAFWNPSTVDLLVTKN